jgi:hypothetical protein
VAHCDLSGFDLPEQPVTRGFDVNDFRGQDRDITALVSLAFHLIGERVLVIDRGKISAGSKVALSRYLAFGRLPYEHAFLVSWLPSPRFQVASRLLTGRPYRQPSAMNAGRYAVR